MLLWQGRHHSATEIATGLTEHGSLVKDISNTTTCDAGTFSHSLIPKRACGDASKGSMLQCSCPPSNAKVAGW